MKKMNKKGFTIVELVIVIAVIAILAAVMIPTFSNIVDKANDSAALQKARNIYTEYVAAHDYVNGGALQQNLIIQVSANEFVAVVGGSMGSTVYPELDDANAAFTGKEVDKAETPTSGDFKDKVYVVTFKSAT